ncbi:MAG: GNAT family N-acetyltransferase [Nocardioides sp.]
MTHDEAEDGAPNLTTRVGLVGPVSPGPQVDRAVEILADAFYHDPLWAWAFPDPQRRNEQHRRLWRLFVEGATRYPHTWLTADRKAVAVWIPPGGSELSAVQEQRFGPLLVDLVGRTQADLVMALADEFHRAHPRDVDHYFLTLLGTDPAHRGQGVGLRLLADTLAMIDAHHQPAYLEASNPANVALYERYGFRTRSMFTAPGGGPKVVTMWRDAR